MQVQEILKELEFNKGKFAREAVEAAIQQRDEITPHLLECLERTAADPVNELEDEDHFLPTYAMYLLAQFREPRAYRPILDIFTQPETSEEVVDLTGEIITEGFGRILASVCHGDLGPVKQMIEAPRLYEYTRSAGLTALVTLVNCGELSRDDAIAYFKELFHGKLERKPSFVWDALAYSCFQLYPEELLEETSNALDEYAFEGMICLEDVHEACRRGKENVLQELKEEGSRQLIGDVIAEMEWWACFNPDPEPPKLNTLWDAGQADKRLAGLGPIPWAATTSPVPSLPHPSNKKIVGRNDPCPCGSGKKFKKCCGK